MGELMGNNFIQWNDTLSVKIDSIDKQHKKWVELMNNLYEAIELGKDDQMMESLLDALAAYVNVHFHYEEKLLKKHEYPNFQKHSEEHKSFTTEVESLKEKYKNGDKIDSKQMMSFLEKWFRDHIMKEDKLYSSFLSEKGVN